jgi:hypothetical protein
MVLKNKKKGGVELSLNLIIMLIIGMVVLGLVIGFVSSLVNKGTEGFDKQLGDNEKIKLEEVSKCGKNLCVVPDPSLTIKKGGKENIFIGVRAFSEDPIICDVGDLEGCVVSYVVQANDDGDADHITLAGPGFNADVGRSDAQMYTLKAGDETLVGTYYLTLKLYEETEDEVSKTITVNVE